MGEENAEEKTDEVKVEDIKPVETDATLEEVANGETKTTMHQKKIIRQIEYYFGDVNLPRDKFLKEKQTEDEGWVSLECLTTFNRLKELSTDLQEILQALEKSKSGLLEINKEDLKVRRSKDKPLPDFNDPVYLKEKKSKTLYISGFPDSYTMDQIFEFFLGMDIQTIFVKMKKDEEYKFKGSIFVEVSTKAEAEKLLKEKELKCEDQPLVIMKREDYFQKKNNERKGGGNEEDEKKDGPILERKTGAVLHFKGMKDDSKREDLKDAFGDIERIAWVDFSMGETQGFIRFAEDGSAQRAIDSLKEKNEGKVIVNDTELEVRVLEGEEEENFWKMTEEEIKKRNKQSDRSHRGRGGRGGHRGGRGGRGGGHRGGRRGDRNNFKGKRKWEDGPRREGRDEQVNAEVKTEPTEPKKVKAEE